MSTDDAEAGSHAHRTRLEAERARMVQQVEELDRTFDELVAAADLEPPDDEHDPDGTTAYERAQVVSLAESARRRIVQLDAALHALDQGTYGRCEGCGEAIAPERLEAVLGTTRCVRCAAGA